MLGLCSWVFLGALLLCMCIGSQANYLSWEQQRVDPDIICYAGASSPPTTLTFTQAANEQSEIEDELGLGAVVLGDTNTWNLREGCESGTFQFNETSPRRGLPIRSQDNCGACWAYAHADFITLWHCEHGNTNDMTKMTQVASLQQHGEQF